MTQCEFLELIRKYGNTDRKIIKGNLKRIMKEKGFTLRNVVELGYKRNNAASWTNKAVPNIPMVDQALDLAVRFNFDVREFLREDRAC
jgi:hypothetical protein